jgi:hypothetical protein
MLVEAAEVGGPTVAVELRENSSTNEVSGVPRLSADRKRMADIAVVAKMARVPIGSSRPKPTSTASMQRRRQVEEPLRPVPIEDLVDNNPTVPFG